MNTKSIFLFIYLFIFICSFSSLKAQKNKLPTTREMNYISWLEFQEIVPDKIETVLLPVGSIEAHGVIPNGTDNIAPEAMAKAVATRLNALIAPTLNFGITESLKAYPGAISVTKNSYCPFVKDILIGLAANKFKNIIILNGHGGNTDALFNMADEVSGSQKVRILVINWWSLVPEITQEVFGNKGGHAGENETAYIQAIVPQHIHPERYSDDLAIANPQGKSWKATPTPSSIGLYEEGKGFPTFKKDQADEYFEKVNNKVAELIKEIIKKWDKAKLYR